MRDPSLHDVVTAAAAPTVPKKVCQWQPLLEACTAGRRFSARSAFLCGPEDLPVRIRGKSSAFDEVVEETKEEAPATPEKDEAPEAPASPEKEEAPEAQASPEKEEAPEEHPAHSDGVNPQCTQTRQAGVARCCLCMNGEAIWSQDGSCKHCKDNGGIKDCSEVDENCKPGSISWPMKHQDHQKMWNEEDDSRGAICAESCAERWISKINGEMNIPSAQPLQKARDLTKQAEYQARVGVGSGIPFS
ncbi:unnamed protein product [Cladocopium goreaui]|uniref:Uncharacterized protein n=1 Tax=Cladocopium goreaui TaxID=2562237 RepID=A0A9P1FG45_9DINO|nr:unnamed protein product [Cladocopium goreaui]